MSAPPVALVMMDSRAPVLQLRGEELTTQTQAKLLTFFTYYLNFKYACRHGYQLLFYKLAGTDCAGKLCVAGCVHPLWGERHPSYCKLAAIAAALGRGHEYVVYIDSDAFFQSTERSLPQLLEAYGGRATPAADAFFGWDWPYTLGPNMGFIVLRNTELGRRLVWAWWHAYSAQFATKHPYEQQTLHWDIMHRAAFRHRIETLRLRPMDARLADPLLHLDHNVGTKSRIWTIARAAAAMLVADGDATLRAALGELRHARSEIPRRRRLPALSAVLAAVRRDFLSLQSRFPMPVSSFNATAAAMEQMPLGLAHAAALLEGAAVHVANCTADRRRGEWQTWRIRSEEREVKARGGTCEGLCWTHSFRLAGAPQLCLMMGSTRTPRQPYKTVAQLGRCGAASPEEALRVRLHFNLAAGTIKTTHRMQACDFRRHLPEQRTNCGFWPACAHVRLLLPKPCWSELPSNVSACGTSDESVNNFLEREAQLPESERNQLGGFHIEPEGPRPIKLANSSAKDRLCLTTWRGFRKPGSAAVFQRCPPKKGKKKKKGGGNDFQWTVWPRITQQGGRLDAKRVKISPAGEKPLRRLGRRTGNLSSLGIRMGQPSIY
ncbi:hypothetical protein AB1Y20_008207 [Prymnesium parvum]|uniref:Nucleotide-diphospho-sugar transferase domain-containing protein n=1 Tax=Prymnesium parvum TaxID=97485 RepID=A0AB34IT10_PRYPA